jgi:hypothetical protein
MRVRLSLVLAAVLIAGALPASAGASGGSGGSIYTKVRQAYLTKGSIDPCEFTSAQLASALKALGTAGGQYFGDFVQAVQSALATRASSQCTTHKHAGGRGGAQASPPPAPSGPSSPGPPLNVGPVTSATGSGVPAPLVAIAVVALVLALLAAGIGLARRSGWDSAWAAACRHSCGEAAYRLAGGWTDFVDWLRSGARG